MNGFYDLTPCPNKCRRFRPKISLRTRTERVSNMWDYDKLEVANKDRTDEVLGATMELQKDGDWNQRNGYGELVALGNWGGKTIRKQYGSTMRFLVRL